jgi:hypothetical protein
MLSLSKRRGAIIPHMCRISLAASLVLRSKRKIHFFVLAGLDPRLSG